MRAPIGSIGIYHLTIFLSAFLLFQIEPVLVKYLLPWFGGSSAVWTTSLLFFQVILVAGYAYSHVLGTRMRQRNQARSHMTLVVISLTLMGAMALVWRSPITPGATWQPTDSSSPILHLLVLLTVSIGLPYFVLAATAPLLQAWFASDYQGTSPYRLYSLSNLGALLALLSYPFVVEPILLVRSQALLWTALYASFGLGMITCAFRHHSVPERNDISGTFSGEDNAMGLNPTRAVYVLWILLAACPSLMLLATTNRLTQDVAPIPFLWVLPMALYLLSFVICFKSRNWYDRRIFHPALGFAIVASCIVLCNPYSGIVRQIIVFSTLLFSICMVCHGELVRLRPDHRHLTAFYLTISVGGALGGVFAAIVAPFLFHGYWEFQLAIAGSTLLLFAVLCLEHESWIHRRVPLVAVALFAAAFCLPEFVGAVRSPIRGTYHIAVILIVTLMAIVAFRPSESGLFRRPGAPVQFAFGTALLVLAAVLWMTVNSDFKGSVFASRNFYGTLAVIESNKSSQRWHNYVMRNGRISHGWQYPNGDERFQPTSYYGATSGIGLLMLRDARRARSAAPGDPFRIGIVGLGAGTIAAYGRPGDYIRYYEINPDVITVATRPNGYFTFVRDSRARIEIIPGDARLSMERELRDGDPQRFDILVIDAFSGDAVPVHLITQEAIEIYLQELKPDGVIAFHITNGYLDLRPVLRALARHLDLRGAWVHDVTTSRMCSTSDWVLLARNDRVLGQSEISAHLRSLDSVRPVRLWTDDYSNLLGVIR